MNQAILLLLRKYTAGQCSPGELQQVRDILAAGTHGEEWQAVIAEQAQHIQIAGEPELADTDFPQQRLYERIEQSIRQIPAAQPRRLWPRYAAAAAILLGLSFGAYLYLKTPAPQQTAQNTEQLAPVQNGVTLKLAGGQQLQLQQKHSGQLASINGTQINQQDSLLSYQGRTITDEIKLNTLTNNGSSKFSVILADGSQATLDIGSSLTYPVAFNSGTREVSLSGQAYFKVKHIAGQRFIVKAKGQLTEDIGTEFNINAYADEPNSRTTLIEGSIKVNGQLLKPGEQASISGTETRIAKADLEEATAWLQGKLIFHHEPLENILAKVARIYNVDIVWVDDLRQLKFGGSVSRSKKLATVLNFFRKAGNVDFIVEGRTVKVIKKKHS